MSEFIESVDDLVARHFSRETLALLGNKPITESVLYQLILSSIEHARNQVEGRRTGSMSYDDAIHLIRTEHMMVARPTWSIFQAICHDKTLSGGEDRILYWQFDNCDGNWSGSGWSYIPSEEDREATDWMPYQCPQDNWVELEFE